MSRRSRQRRDKRAECHIPDEAVLTRLWANGAKAWRTVPDAAAWVDELRGNTMTDTTDQFQPLRDALSADHTPLPWIGAGPSYGAPLPIKLDSIVGGDEDGQPDDCAPTVCRDTSDEDNMLIQAAVNAAPALLAEVERLQSALSEALALTRCACGDSFTSTDPGKCVNCRAADGEALADKVQLVAHVAEVHMSRYTVEWTNGPLPEGAALYAPHPVVADKAQPAALLVHDLAASIGAEPPAVSAKAAGEVERRFAAPPVAPAAPVAPQGWRVVPEVPTPEMRQAAVDAICYGPEEGFTRIAGPDRCWAVMLAAAPPAPAAAPAEGARWLPIESAPKGDVLVDILMDNGRRYAGCHYDRICGEFRHITACGVLVRLKGARYWMPIPAAPTEAPNDQA